MNADVKRGSVTIGLEKFPTPNQLCDIIHAQADDWPHTARIVGARIEWATTVDVEVTLEWQSTLPT
jgi:hypothetical protein